MMKSSLLSLLLVMLLAGIASAQEVDVDKYNITARIDLATGTLDSQATLDLSNPTDIARSKLYFKLTRLGKVGQVLVNGASAENETAQDHRSQALNQIVVTPPSPLLPHGHVTVTINYKIQAPEATGIIAIYPGEVLLLPESVWFPSPSTAFAIYGPNTAPFTLNVSVSPASSGFQAVSSGVSQGTGGAQATFTQTLNSLPVVVAGDFGPAISSDHGGVKISLYLQSGVTRSTSDQGTPEGADGHPTAGTGGTGQAGRITAEIGRIIDFYTKTLGPAPAGASFACISSAHAGNSATAGSLILNEQIFREDFLDAGTIGLLADAVSRIWVEGRVRLRGEDSRSAEPDHPAQKARSVALLKDSVPRYLAVLYLGDRFGRQAANEAFGRMRSAYTPVAQSHRDSELSVQSFVIPSYGDAVFAKGPLVLRMLGHTIGEDKLLEAIRTVTAGAQTKIVTMSDFHAALGKSAPVDTWFKQWIDTLVEPDIIIGIPLAGTKPDTQQVNLRNLGTGDVEIPVLAITASGKKFTASALVPSDDLTSVEIPTAEKIESVEADPEKYVVQSNYDNDCRPVRLSTTTLLNNGIVAFNAKKLDEADAKLTAAVKQNPSDPLLHAWLGRVLMAENRLDQAAHEADLAIKTIPPLASALTWAHITMGQIALAKNAPGDAVDNLRRAVLETTEEPAEFTARDALINAEKLSGKLQPVDPSIKAFMTQFDAVVRQPSSDKVFSMVMKSTLKRFGESMVLNPAEAWSTEIQRAERIDAHRVALDVAIKVRSKDTDQSGTAVFILYQSGGAWMLENVRLFSVK
ncbi:MAG TPA: hypothetical protein VLZ81_08085 [Blastocatellia bacterium]|nr:hypothetical protein [Blastocatellia bacterium]